MGYGLLHQRLDVAVAEVAQRRDANLHETRYKGNDDADDDGENPGVRLLAGDDHLRGCHDVHKNSHPAFASRDGVVDVWARVLDSRVGKAMYVNVWGREKERAWCA